MQKDRHCAHSENRVSISEGLSIETWNIFKVNENGSRIEMGRGKGLYLERKPNEKEEEKGRKVRVGCRAGLRPQEAVGR